MEYYKILNLRPQMALYDPPKREWSYITQEELNELSKTNFKVRFEIHRSPNFKESSQIFKITEEEYNIGKSNINTNQYK